MNHNLLGLIITFAFVFAVLGVSALASKKAGKEISRKITHIGVANCWWIFIYFFDSPVWASIPLASFVVLNFFSVKFNLIKSIEREEGGGGGAAAYGTVYYPLSMLILTILAFGGHIDLYIGSIAVMCMGYGDGFAAVAGGRFGRHKLKFLKSDKSLEGCVAMFAASFVSTGIILFCRDVDVIFALLKAVPIALAATVLEAVTPDGYDNITVPLGVGLFVFTVF